MGFLNPLFLLAGAAVAIPLLIHLLHRQRVREFVFPALRYLRRTERDHARRIRLRQLLVLLLRIGAILLLAVAGARPFLRGMGSAHPPTALAVVLDNSASSGAIVGDERVLDRLKAHARSTVERASDQDRIWVVRAGTPWVVAVPGSREEALAAIEATDVSDAAGDLTATVSRVAGLVAASDLPAREVHVVSDLQSSALDVSASDSTEIAEGVPVLILRPDWDAPKNGSLTDVVVGGGLAPIVGRPTEVTARVGEGVVDADTIATRLWVGDEVRGVARGTANAEVVFPVPTVAPGVMSGFVERDPDALRSDDRRYFSASPAPPPAVAVRGGQSPFLDDALDVLSTSGRISRGDGTVDVLIAHEGLGIRAVGAVAPAWVIIPPADPARLPALNQRLRSANIPWRFEEDAALAARRLVARDFPHPFDEILIERAYRVEPSSGAQPIVHAELESGEPWLVSGTTGTSRYLLLASPLDPEWSNLPVSSLMIPMFEWALSRWARASSETPILLAGERFEPPPGVRSLAGPQGNLVPVEVSGGVVLEKAGLYDLLGGGEVALLGRIAVNVPASESDLRPASEAVARAALGPGAVLVSADQWSARAFTQRQGPEIWRSILGALLAVLLLESLIAASGRADPEPPPSTL